MPSRLKAVLFLIGLFLLCGVWVGSPIVILFTAPQLLEASDLGAIPAAGLAVFILFRIGRQLSKKEEISLFRARGIAAWIVFLLVLSAFVGGLLFSGYDTRNERRIREREIWISKLAPRTGGRIVNTTNQAVKSQSAAASQVAATPRPTPTGPPELRSIMWVSANPSAQLDKNWAFEGDHVRGYKLTKINRDSVDLLTPDGAPFKLFLPAQVAGK